MCSDPISNTDASDRSHAAVSLVVPARNEARNIPWVFEQIPVCVDEVILVDGDSSDATVLMTLQCLPTVQHMRLDITPLRRIGNHVLRAAANRLYHASLTDLCYGCCAIRRTFLDQRDLHAVGFEIEAEVIVHAVRSRLHIAEVPSLELPLRSGRSDLQTISDGRQVLRTILSERPGLYSSPPNKRKAS